MAEKIVVRKPTKFTGSAAERAGMSTTGLLPGDVFYEDTGKKYRFDGSAWQERKVAIGELPAVTATLIDFVAKEFFDETDLVLDEYTFAAAMKGIRIINDSLDDLQAEIGGLSFGVKAGEGFAQEFDDFTVVEITSTGTLSFRAYGLGVRS